MSGPHSGSRFGLAAAAVALSAAVAYWAATGDQTTRVPAHLAVWFVAFVAYLLALRSADSVNGRHLTAALGLAVVWRFLLVSGPPLLSDDVHRYVWEGRIQIHGGNPYAWQDRPQAERWQALRDPIWQGVNHKGYTAIYPPVWQLAARGVVGLHDSVWAMKLFVVLCELGAWVVLAALLRGRGLPPGRLLVLAWSPLALVEIAGSGHHESLGLLLVALALLSLEARRGGYAAAALAAAFHVKLLPALFGLAWLRRFRSRDLALGAGIALLLVLPFASAGAGLLSSLGRYGDEWRFNDALFTPLAALVGDRSAVWIAAGICAALALALGLRRADPTLGLLAVVTAFLLLAPSVLPWYALWLLVPLVLRDEPGALLFTGTVALAYLVYPAWLSGAAWHLAWPWRVLEYGPCLGLGLVAARPARAR